MFAAPRHLPVRGFRGYIQLGPELADGTRMGVMSEVLRVAVFGQVDATVGARGQGLGGVVRVAVPIASGTTGGASRNRP
jgi:hypothetical protein